MELSNQVCSLELSKQLKNLGFKQDSLFYWIRNVNINLDSDEDIYYLSNANEANYSLRNDLCLEIIPAYTVAELVNMLLLFNIDDTINLRDITADYLANKLINHYEESKI